MYFESEQSFSESINYTDWDYSKIHFPDFSKHSIINLPEIDAKYLPSNINMKGREYRFDNELNTGNQPEEVPGYKIITNNARNWKEFKDMNTCDIKEKLKHSGCQSLWNGEIQPILNPSQTNTQGLYQSTFFFHFIIEV